MSNVIKKLPAVALRGANILPGMISHFDVSRTKSIKAVETAMMKDQILFLVAQKSTDVEEPGIEDVYKIGTICIVKQIVKIKPGLSPRRGSSFRGGRGIP